MRGAGKHFKSGWILKNCIHLRGRPKSISGEVFWLEHSLVSVLTGRKHWGIEEKQQQTKTKTCLSCSLLSGEDM